LRQVCHYGADNFSDDFNCDSTAQIAARDYPVAESLKRSGARRARFHEALDVAAGRKMFALGAQHDDVNPIVEIERLECLSQLVALRQGDDIERQAGKNDVGAFALGVDLDPKAV
jgi:hypothetical protein